MATQYGTLLFNHRRITLQIGDNDIDTGLCQENQALSPDPGVAARTMVLAMPPYNVWAFVRLIGEPFIDPDTGTVHVTLTNDGGAPFEDLNVLFMIPHTLIGPVSADTYQP